MTLTTNAKNYIATHFGSNTCFARSGIRYTDPNGMSHTGSTGDVVKTLRLNAGGSARGPGGETFYDIPDFQSISDADVRGIDSTTYCVDDGGSGGGMISQCDRGDTRCNRGNIETCNSSRQWAVSTHCPNGCRVVNNTPECIPSSGGGGGSQDTTGPMEVWVGESSGTGCSPGDPDATIDTSNAYAYYKSDPTPYVGVMDIMVRNNNNEDCYAYFAWEMRMWAGSGFTRCPTTTPEVTEISRFLATVSATKNLTLKKVLANETEMVSGSFEIPHGVEGQKTICLTLWGNYSYTALVAELAAEGYSKEIPW